MDAYTVLYPISEEKEEFQVQSTGFKRVWYYEILLESSNESVGPQLVS